LFSKMHLVLKINRNSTHKTSQFYRSGRMKLKTVVKIIQSDVN
jgi:hypothetical protein